MSNDNLIIIIKAFLTSNEINQVSKSAKGFNVMKFDISDLNKEEIKREIVDDVKKAFSNVEKICYWPITQDHALISLSEYCFDDPQSDLDAVAEIIDRERKEGNPRFK